MKRQQTIDPQQPRISVRKHWDSYYYIWLNGKRQEATAYGDITAARLGVADLKKRLAARTQ